MFPTHVDNLSAETSVLVTNTEQLFSWHEYGLSLHIPENSLPDNLHQCSIHIKASIMGDYQLPQDTHLVSAVYWMECVPKCQFSEPLTLEVQHCAKPETISKLCFVKSNFKEAKAIFRAVDSTFDQCVFPYNTSYGFIELNGFSGYGVAQKGSKERDYRASVYYCEENPKSHQIHFVITWNTNAHRKVHVCGSLHDTLQD